MVLMGRGAARPQEKAPRMSWTDDLAIEKRRRESLEERKANFLQWASLRTPSMTERLIGQLRTDTANVVRSLGISVKTHLDSSKFQVTLATSRRSFFR